MKGTVWYGIHFYPGVAEYRPPNQAPFRVFLNEDTIRSMDPSFAGCPVYVHHKDDIPSRVDDVRKESDGWVIESFFNQADGKHWAKFIIVTDRGNSSIKRGMRLSNAYQAQSFAGGGLWNGVSYDKEVKGGAYNHLAIVPDPRYEESTIMTPDEFKQYNEEKLAELQRLANNKDQQETKPMAGKFSFFKRNKVENAADLEDMVVLLPKSKQERVVADIINAMDEQEMEKGKEGGMMANGEHHVMVGDSKMTVNELIGKHAAMCNELAALKEKHGGDEADKDAKETAMQNAVTDAEKKAKDAEAEALKLKNELEETKKKAAKAKADDLRNAADRAAQTKVEAPKIETSEEQLARGTQRYGSAG